MSNKRRYKKIDKIIAIENDEQAAKKEGFVAHLSKIIAGIKDDKEKGEEEIN
jgi:hypothetical protein